MQWRSVEVIPFIFNELSVASVKKYVITVSYAFFFKSGGRWKKFL